MSGQEKTEKCKQQDRPVGYRPRVVVKFHDYVELPYVDGVEKVIEREKLGPCAELLAAFPGLTFQRMYTAVEADELVKLAERAQNLDRTYRPPNFLTYFIVECPPAGKPEALIAALSGWQTVENVYFDPPGDEPFVAAGDDPMWGNQGYLDPAPDGIDAEYAWTFLGGDGAGQNVIDLERGWTLNHEDLVAKGGALLHGAIRDGSRAHGTSVLGELCAVDNALGCVEIAPNVNSVNAVSYWTSNRPDAIMAAIANLSFGDVLLLEAQLPVAGLPPIETLDAEFEAIRLATALGIVVVEAAGNGSTDLDGFTNAAGKFILNRGHVDFRDSGAIMVGAAGSTAPHQRIAMPAWSWGTNYGSRIDCYAWGENVSTCHSDSGGATDLYRSTFNGTSSASPIVTGAALIVQGLAEANLGYRFNPFQLRALLSNPATGTPSANPPADKIGVMPDLRAIINSKLCVTPDIYMRDFVGDNGDPHAGSISASPDIILRRTAVADPQASFGEGSGTENSNTLGARAEAGQNNYLYVRMRNRGGSAANNVKATVYWSPPATLLTPDLWTPVGAVTVPSVPTGNVLTVSDAIVWPEDDIPGTGHYCFVGLVDSANDPAPNPADFLNWDNFRRFIRENNNVTWRNFNVVDYIPDLEIGFFDWPVLALPFLMPGAPDRARPMGLEVVGHLPQGARAWLEVPAAFMDQMQMRSPYVRFDRKLGLAWLPVNPCGPRLIDDFMVAAKARLQMRLLVYLPEEHHRQGYELFARQLYRGEEVGRVTWRLVPPRRQDQY
jgi:hypothetical protein